MVKSGEEVVSRLHPFLPTLPLTERTLSTRARMLVLPYVSVVACGLSYIVKTITTIHPVDRIPADFTLRGHRFKGTTLSSLSSLHDDVPMLLTILLLKIHA